MTPSVVSIKNFIDESIRQIQRSEELKALGNTKDGMALESEWNDASALSTLFINVDTFVRQ